MMPIMVPIVRANEVSATLDSEKLYENVKEVELVVSK